MPSIFLSYRREDTGPQAGRLADRLFEEFGERHVFLDLDSIGAGEDFPQRIDDALSNTDVALVLIGPEWATVRVGDRRRLDDPADWVRIEVAAALQRDDVLVVPVLVENAEMPTPEELPHDLKPLTRHNALPLSTVRWRSESSDLITALRSKRKIKRTQPGSDWSRLSRRGRILAGVGAAVVALFVVVVVVAVTGGGKSGGGGASTPSFPSKANAICKTSLSQESAIPVPTSGSPTLLANYLVRVLPIAQGQHDQLNALTPPPSQAALFQQYLAGLAQAISISQTALSSVQAGNTTQANAYGGQLAGLGQSNRAKASALGLTECAM